MDSNKISSSFFMKQISLDVSTLPAPEPFNQIVNTLATMGNESFLKVIHRKQPLLLYPVLQEKGYYYHVQKGKNELFEILIWHVAEDNNIPSASKSMIPPNLVFPNLALFEN